MRLMSYPSDKQYIRQPSPSEHLPSYQPPLYMSSITVCLTRLKRNSLNANNTLCVGEISKAKDEELAHNFVYKQA